MLAKIFVVSGKNKVETVVLPSPIDSYVFQAFKENNEAAALLMSEEWPNVESTYGKVDHVELSEYDVIRYPHGEKTVFEASCVIDNVNMTQMLDGIAKWVEAKKRVSAEHATVKALLKQSVKETVKGYEAGKRGRQAKQSVSVDAARQAIRNALAAAKAK